jgi:hypothetical protein
MTMVSVCVCVSVCIGGGDNDNGKYVCECVYLINSTLHEEQSIF